MFSERPGWRELLVKFCWSLKKDCALQLITNRRPVCRSLPLPSSPLAEMQHRPVTLPVPAHLPAVPCPAAPPRRPVPNPCRTATGCQRCPRARSSGTRCPAGPRPAVRALTDDDGTGADQPDLLLQRHPLGAAGRAALLPAGHRCPRRSDPLPPGAHAPPPFWGGLGRGCPGRGVSQADRCRRLSEVKAPAGSGRRVPRPPQGPSHGGGVWGVRVSHEERVPGVTAASEGPANVSPEEQGKRPQ